jgi:hypothetical protein
MLCNCSKIVGINGILLEMMDSALNMSEEKNEFGQIKIAHPNQHTVIRELRRYYLSWMFEKKDEY